MVTAEMVLTAEQARLLRFAALNGDRLSTGPWQAVEVRKAVEALVRMGMLSRGYGWPSSSEWRHVTGNGQAWLTAHPARSNDKETN